MQRDMYVLIVILMAFGCSASMETTKMMAEQEGSQRSSDPLVTANNAPVTPDGERFLVWAEEFDGPELSSDMWFIETGDCSQYNIPGWGNNELQWYTPDNVRIEDGVLLIEARTEQRNGRRTPPVASIPVTVSPFATVALKPAFDCLGGRGFGQPFGYCRRQMSMVPGRRQAKSISWRPSIWRRSHPMRSMGPFTTGGSGLTISTPDIPMWFRAPRRRHSIPMH